MILLRPLVYAVKIPAHSLAQTARPVLVIGAALLWAAGCWTPQGEARPKPGDTMLLAPQTPAQEKLFADGPVCRIATFSRAVASYDFGGDLSEHFVYSSRWLSHESILVDGIRLDTQAIDAIGRVDWHLEDGELLDVGIMGFAENTDLQSDAPSIGDFRICERI